MHSEQALLNWHCDIAHGTGCTRQPRHLRQSLDQAMCSFCISQGRFSDHDAVGLCCSIVTQLQRLGEVHEFRAGSDGEPVKASNALCEDIPPDPSSHREPHPANVAVRLPIYLELGHKVVSLGSPCQRSEGPNNATRTLGIHFCCSFSLNTPPNGPGQSVFASGSGLTARSPECTNTSGTSSGAWDRAAWSDATGTTNRQQAPCQAMAHDHECCLNGCILWPVP
mmetsp:Transcript_78297/g.181673  ORF Transcript_78297/g.181673 Transcript_78297/m.181673 type:complete len:224 (+) Transcript_78297:105-776(+)